MEPGSNKGADGELSCELVRSRLSLLLGEDLPEAEDRRIRCHLQSCWKCRRELGTYMKTRKLLASMAPDRLGSPQFFERLHGDILERVGASSGQAFPEATPRRDWSRASGVAAAAALFLIGLLIGMHGDRPVAGLLVRPPISNSSPSASDPSSPTVPVGYFGGRESLSRTVRATLERAAREHGEMSEADKVEFAKRFRRLCLRRTLECGEVHPSADLAADPGDEECRQLLRRFMRECRKR